VDKGRLGSIVSVLGHCELTSLEKQFLGRVKEYFEKNGQLTEQQESILEGIYREKLRWMKKGVQRKEAYTVKSAI
jgi:hypothetical protein